MHSLEAGVIVSIAVFFFFNFLNFVFLREINISKEIERKVIEECKEYSSDSTNRKYEPEKINNIMNIVIDEGELKDEGNDEE